MTFAFRSPSLRVFPASPEQAARIAGLIDPDSKLVQPITWAVAAYRVANGPLMFAISHLEHGTHRRWIGVLCKRRSADEREIVSAEAIAHGSTRKIVMECTYAEGRRRMARRAE